jgi:hypothetical protein
VYVASSTLYYAFLNISPSNVFKLAQIDISGTPQISFYTSALNGGKMYHAYFSGTTFDTWFYVGYVNAFANANIP